MGAAAIIIVSGPAFAQKTELQPVDDFIQNSKISQVRLSPNGKNLAFLVALKDGRVKLATMPTNSNDPKIVASVDGADIGSFHWVTSERLVFSTADYQSGAGDQQTGPGLYAINRDGSGLRLLVTRTATMMSSTTSLRVLQWNHQFHSVVPSEAGAEIYVSEFKFNSKREVDAVNLLRLDTVTGKSTTVDRPGKTQQWVTDQKGEPRAVTTLDDGTMSVFYKDPSTQQWRKLDSFDVFDPKFKPEGFGSNGTFYVSAHAGKDKAALYEYDLAKNQIRPEPLVSLKQYDFTGEFIEGAKGILGVRYETDAPNTYWFDARYRTIQQEVDKVLPTTVNAISGTLTDEAKTVVVRSASDVQPAKYYLYDTAAKTFSIVGESQPQIDPKKMAQKDMIRYGARDGLEIPAYLTLPNGVAPKNLPLVVLVHGGPYVRGGSWMWDPGVQFLASRGYAVLEPEFRGSTGFGDKHFRAGWKQWGLKMQDDIADGAKWAVEKGIADGKRICIAGASYGGYATLMGLVNDPGLYQCGVNWVGVTDINLMYTVNWSDSSDIWKTYGMPRLVGDPVVDAQQLKATSPLEQAAKITKPLLLAYGGSDLRVPIVHGTKFRDAVKKTNPDVEWVEYKEEGHGWTLVKNRMDFWTKVETFLNRNIGPGAQPAK